ncbi:MAG: LamG domain-containing protein, partial [Flavobacteriales bacterium]|nr:LamG domain-containing protein [Flavobacteriales bacterium]
MKKLLLFLLISVGLNAQFNYQAIVKDSDGNPVTNNQVKFKFSLMYQSSTATPVYVEEHDLITPSDGVVNLSVGEGTVVNGTFSDIDWSQSVFMKEELDTGSGYQDMGIKQIASVPVAEYAKNAANLFYNVSNSQSSTSIVETTSVVSASAFIGDGSSLLWSQSSTQTLSDKINELISLNNVGLPTYIPTDGLVAYYPFNGNADDASGNGNDGSVSGQVSLTSDISGVANSAYEFIVDGDAGWGQPQGEISVPHNVSMNSNSLTLSALVYPREKPGSYENRAQTVLGRWANGTSNEAFRFWVDDDGGVMFNVRQNESYKAGNILFDAWSHIAITLDNRDLKIFINGSLVGEHQFDSDINVNGNSPLNIGSLLSSNGTWYFWDGYLDEIGYWNRALSSNEIKNISSSFSLYSSPTSCFTCNTTDTESNTIIEATGIVSATGFKGNGNNITLTESGTTITLMELIEKLKSEIKSLRSINLNLLGPIALYSMENNTSNTFPDYNGISNQITFDSNNMVIGSYAGIFDGSSSFINLGDYDFLGNDPATTNSFSISTWCYFTDLESTNNSIITKWDNEGEQKSWYFGQYDQNFQSNSRNLHFAHSDNNGNETLAFSNNFAVTENNWHHCVLVWDRSTVKFYVDGINVGTVENNDFNEAVNNS